MLHEHMADCYDFLGLMGFKRMHEYHFIKEAAEMRGVHRYYINHFNMLVPETDPRSPFPIPSAWANFTRQSVEPEAKREAVRTCMEKWVDWERSTKLAYEKYYTELCEIGEIAAACKVKDLVCDVDQELKCAERLCLDLCAVDYSMDAVVLMQHGIHEEYREKTDGIGVRVC